MLFLCCFICCILPIYPIYLYFFKKPSQITKSKTEVETVIAAPSISCLRGSVYDANYVTSDYKYDSCDFQKFAQWRCFNQDGGATYDAMGDFAGQLGYDCSTMNSGIDHGNICATLKAGNWSPEAVGCTIKEPAGSLTNKNIIQKSTGNCIDGGGTNYGMYLAGCGNDKGYGNNTWQMWTILPNGILINRQSLQCMDAGNVGGTSTNCDPSNTNQVWSYNKNGQLVSGNGKCLDVINNNSAWAMNTCNTEAPNQIWKLGDTKLY